MRIFVVPIVAVLAAALLMPAAAQRRTRGGKQGVGSSSPANGKGGKEEGAVAVTLGRSSHTGGVISKAVFDSFARQGVMPEKGAVVTFSFTYAERKLYEDSVGNPLLKTDFLTEYCNGPHLSDGIVESLFERTKPGDTAFFENIKLLLPGGATAYGKNMKFVLAR